jgi:enterochelin esterase-like enzyme
MDFFSKKWLVCIILGGFFLTSCAVQSTPAAPTPLPTPTATPLPTPTMPTPTATGCTETAGHVQLVTVPTQLLKQEIELRVFTPPCYDPAAATRYSVLYMLHGQTFDDSQWQSLGLFSAADQLIDSRQIYPFLIVLPNEADSVAFADTSKFGDALVEEVIPYVDKHFATCSAQACRGIGGLSRGGNWAVRIGFSNPQRFAVIGAHSTPLFYGDLERLPEWAADFPQDQQIIVSHATTTDADSKTTTITEETLTAPMIYIDFGEKDEEKSQMLAFDQSLSQLGVVHQMIEFDGYHDPAYWSAHLDIYLKWYAAALSAPSD